MDCDVRKASRRDCRDGTSYLTGDKHRTNPGDPFTVYGNCGASKSPDGADSNRQS